MTEQSSTLHRDYWVADTYGRRAGIAFERADEQGDSESMRRIFYAAATMYARTLEILPQALERQNTRLALAAAGNLVPLHSALAGMHVRAPEVVPAPLTVHDHLRTRFLQDMIIRALDAAGRPLSLEGLEERVEERRLTGDVRPGLLARALADLHRGGILVQDGAEYARTDRPYVSLNLDREALEALLPAGWYERLKSRDFPGVSDIAARAAQFVHLAVDTLGWDSDLARGFAGACTALASYQDIFPSALPCFDLIHSSLPRPYQYEVFAVFKGMGYNGQVVEAPTGSGKTMIGMMCMQDWLAGMPPEERILVLVPTQSYQRQWVRELCYLPTGLQLPPNAVWAGPPAGLEGYRRRYGGPPPVLVMTYSALAGIVTGWDDPATAEPEALREWLTALNVQHVILDEVHKVAQDLDSPTARLAAAVAAWNRSGTIRNLVGFSGTAAAYRDRFEQLGLELVYIVPAVELIAYGFVAPFTELSAPFAYSALEREIHDALDQFKDHLRNFYAAVGAAELRSRWADIPLERRMAATRALGIGESSSGGSAALQARVEAAGVGEHPVALTETWLVALLQGLEGLSDDALAREARDPEAALASVRACREIAGQLQELVRLPSLRGRLGKLAEADDAAPPIEALVSSQKSQAARRHQMRDAVAVTVSGTALSFGEWYRQTGEGRVGAIRAVLNAERRTRPVPGAIVFDVGRAIPWHHDVPAPGYGGVGGTFAELLRDPLPGVTPLAALSEEFYLPLDPPGLCDRVAEFIRDRIQVGEIGQEILELATYGLELPDPAVDRLREAITSGLAEYARTLETGRVRAGEFRRRVLTPLRQSLRDLHLGPQQSRIAERLTARNRHLLGLIRAFFDHGAVAMLFRKAEVREFVGTDSERRSCAVIELPGGQRRQLLFEMTSRILDAPELEINLILVSGWARTGWNVRLPNVLVDATATRNTTAWQQLRGRAMRALPTWTPACARAVSLLIGREALELDAEADLPADVREVWRSLPVFAPGQESLDPEVRDLFESVIKRTEKDLRTAMADGSLRELTEAQRHELIVRLMCRYNKVTHIYELVKAYGESQVIKEGGTWVRRPAIEAKHDHETSVNPLDGRLSAGAAHAPLLYASDPRTDVPQDLEETLFRVLEEADDTVVTGWARALSS
jgi:superfamily II DNA or RNA helicase